MPFSLFQFVLSQGSLRAPSELSRLRVSSQLPQSPVRDLSELPQLSLRALSELHQSSLRVPPELIQTSLRLGMLLLMPQYITQRRCAAPASGKQIGALKKAHSTCSPTAWVWPAARTAPMPAHAASDLHDPARQDEDLVVAEDPRVQLPRWRMRAPLVDTAMSPRFGQRHRRHATMWLEERSALRHAASPLRHRRPAASDARAPAPEVGA